MEQLKIRSIWLSDLQKELDRLREKNKLIQDKIEQMRSLKEYSLHDLKSLKDIILEQ